MTYCCVVDITLKLARKNDKLLQIALLFPYIPLTAPKNTPSAANHRPSPYVPAPRDNTSPHPGTTTAHSHGPRPAPRSGTPADHQPHPSPSAPESPLRAPPPDPHTPVSILLPLVCAATPAGPP